MSIFKVIRRNPRFSGKGAKPALARVDAKHLFPVNRPGEIPPIRAQYLDLAGLDWGGEVQLNDYALLNITVPLHLRSRFAVTKFSGLA